MSFASLRREMQVQGLTLCHVVATFLAANKSQLRIMSRNSRTGHDTIEARFDHLTEVARRAGVKLTHQRLEIFRELAGSDDHPDVDTLYRAVQRRVPTVSVDTVYRTMWKLHELGLVQTLGPSRDALRFDPNLAPHHHYTCVRCGLVRDFTSADLDALALPPAARALGSVAAAHVEVRGVCNQCQPAKARPAKPSRSKR
ncbi:MAG: transcriptional repressor [Kofleriaceae bacterium]|nr:transcriptional repressor [Kofleriaceae bacterium]MBP6837320.1 transcriptional repressor [Kofleriaceae bacterium]